MKTNGSPKPGALRNKVRIEPIRSREELGAVAITAASLHREADKARLIRDEKVAGIEEEFNLRVEELERELGAQVKRLKAWAVKHRKDEFGDRQSLEVAGHRIEFRKGTGKVAYTPGTKAGDALDAVLAADDDALVEKFVSIKASLDKNAIIRAVRESKEAEELLKELGIVVLIEEEFSFRPNRPEADAVAGGKEGA